MSFKINRSNLIIGADKIKGALKSIKNRGVKLEQDVHIAACSVLNHVDVKESVADVQAFIGDMVNSLPKSYRINAMRDWLSLYGPVSFDGNKPHFDPNKTIDLEGAMANPFWELSPEPEYKPADTNAMLDAMIKRLQADEKKMMAKGQIVNHADVITGLEALKTKSRKPQAFPIEATTPAEEKSPLDA